MNISKAQKIGFVLILIVIAAATLVLILKPLLNRKIESEVVISEEEAKKIIEKKAQEVVLLLRNKNFKELSFFVHPDKGVRFSPYSYVNKEKDIVFSKDKIANIDQDTEKYLWGIYDGSGRDIYLTFKEYFNRFVYDKDFINADEVGYNNILGTGNMINNIFEAYPSSIFVEFHFKGFEPQYEGMDWKSLRLVFEKKGNIWYLVGVIHDEWTI